MSDSITLPADESAALEADALQPPASGASQPSASGASPAPTSAPKPRFIENPLPLPKKHEKREMGYQYEVPLDKMKYDVEVGDDDDFDR